MKEKSHVDQLGTEKLLTGAGLNLPDLKDSEGRQTPAMRAKTPLSENTESKGYTDRSGTNMSAEDALKFESKEMVVSYDLKASHL
jgi:hypothetical protein